MDERNFGVELPDGSGCAVVSMALPKGHWIYSTTREHPQVLPLILRESPMLKTLIREAVMEGVKSATESGTDMDFDPDALVQATIYRLYDPSGQVFTINKKG